MHSRFLRLILMVIPLFTSEPLMLFTPAMFFRTTAFPVIDTNNGGTLNGTLAALGRLIGIAGPDTKIVPGHGVVSNRMDVIGFRDMILDVKSRVEPMVAQGMSYDQVSAADPTSAYNARYGDSERFLRALYSELSGEP